MPEHLNFFPEQHRAVEHYAMFTVPHNIPNQDARFALPHKGIFGILDGAGGHNAGEIASKQGSLTLQKHLKDFRSDNKTTPEEIATHLSKAILLTHEEIQKQAQKEGQHGMKSTVVLAKLWQGRTNEKKAVFAWVGDSRGDLRRDGKIAQITMDDGILKEALGETSYARALQDKLNNLTAYTDLSTRPIPLNKPIKLLRNDKWITTDSITEQDFFYNSQVLLQSIGGTINCVNTRIIDVLPGDQLILATDGLQNLTSKQIETIMKDTPQPQNAVEALGNAARRKSQEKRTYTNVRPHPDDITLAIIGVK